MSEHGRSPGPPQPGPPQPGPPQPGPPPGLPSPAAANAAGIGSAVAVFGAASVALAAAVIATNATTGSTATPAPPVPDAGTAGNTTGTSAGNSTGGPPTGGTLVGDWTGEVSAGGSQNGVIFTIESDSDPAAVEGYLQIRDPEDGTYSLGGVLTGSSDGAALNVTSGVGARFSLTVAGDTITGTGTFPGRDAPLDVQVRATRA